MRLKIVSNNMTKRIKGWIVKRADTSVMDLEYIMDRKEPLLMYRMYTNREDAQRMNASHDEENIKEAMLIYKD